MIKLFPSFIVLILFIGCNDSFTLRNQNFPNTPFTKVIAYQFETGNNDVLLTNDTGKTLSKQQVNTLLNIFNEPGYFDDRLGLRCFKPDLKFVFYDLKNQPISTIEISFECNQISSFPELEYQSFSLDGYERMREGLFL